MLGDTQLSIRYYNVDGARMRILIHIYGYDGTCISVPILAPPTLSPSMDTLGLASDDVTPVLKLRPLVRLRLIRAQREDGPMLVWTVSEIVGLLVKQGTLTT